MENSFDKLKLIIDSLNNAILSHHEWTGNIIAISLLNDESIKLIIDADAHKKCKSYDLLTNIENEKFFSETTLLKQIQSAHKDMHDRARDLILSYQNEEITNEVLALYIHSQQEFVSRVESLKSRLSTLINTADPLTGLPTRPSLQLQIRDMTESKADNLFIVIIDLDHFKKVNDTYGHNAGDEVLRTFSLSLQSKIRSTEKLYRYGGEEFVMLIYADNNASAGNAGSRLCKNIRDTKYRHNDTIIEVTATIGIAKYKYDLSFEDNLEIADQALYYGKSAGRDRCIIDDGQGHFIDYSTICDH
ncbi:diguanylate cyclase [Kluyvera genomosp. 1]|uniref:diguanylate cyclase n=1 Tax=Kluyvera genomosp. 1 TaxID=2774053 RepID=UPI00068CE678|nr:diguanylate cyclase [Kluyvera genomosp. 1]